MVVCLFVAGGLLAPIDLPFKKNSGRDITNQRTSQIGLSIR